MTNKDNCIKNDELKVYRGEDFVVSKHITIHQPQLGEICDYGEQEYYSMIYQLVATPQSMKWQLWDAGIDYTTISPYELFYSLLYKMFPLERTSIVFGDLDFTKFQVGQNRENDSICLYQKVYSGSIYKDGNLVYEFKNLLDASRFIGCNYDDLIKNLSVGNQYEEYIFDDVKSDVVIIDEFTYMMITDYLRQVHMIQKDEKLPANETTKMILIEDDKEEYERNKNKEHHSQLKNLISSLINCEGFKYDHSKVWDMKINAFMDSVKRISKIKNADLLMQSGYSGFGINLKDVDKQQLDWLGELQ